MHDEFYLMRFNSVILLILIAYYAPSINMNILLA